MWLLDVNRRAIIDLIVTVPIQASLIRQPSSRSTAQQPTVTARASYDRYNCLVAARQTAQHVHRVSGH
jgi:hypothetical protein